MEKYKRRSSFIIIFFFSFFCLSVFGVSFFFFKKTKKDEGDEIRNSFVKAVAQPQSEFVIALQNGDIEKLKELTSSKFNMAQQRNFFQSGISFFDLHPQFVMKNDFSEGLGTMLIDFLNVHLGEIGAETAKTKVFAARLLARVSRFQTNEKLQGMLIKIAENPKEDLSIRLTLVDTLSKFKKLSNESLDLIKKTAKSKDAGTSQSGLMIGEQIQDPDAAQAFSRWVLENQFSFLPSNQPLAFKIAVVFISSDEQREKMIKTALKKNDESWRDAILSALASHQNLKVHKDDIKEIYNKTQSPVIRQRADILLKSMGVSP